MVQEILVLVLLGVVFLLMAVYRFKYSPMHNRNAVTLNAVVMDIERIDLGRRRRIYMVYVQYIFNGMTYRTKVRNVYGALTPAIGKGVTVMLNPHEPDRPEIKTFTGVLVTWILLILAGGSFLFAQFIFLKR